MNRRSRWTLAGAVGFKNRSFRRLTTQLRVDPRGLLVGYAATGNDYLKTAVDEKFDVTDGTARWKSAKEAGTKPAKGDSLGFYFPADGPPEIMAALARALLASPSQRLNLLPDGVAEIQKVETVEVETGAGPRKINHYSITGLDLEPTSIWLDGDTFSSLRTAGR